MKRDPPVPFTFTSMRSPALSCHRSISEWNCSKGFYVRTYAHDIGQELGCGAHLHALRRTRSGKFDLTAICELRRLKGEKTRPRHREDAFSFRSFYFAWCLNASRRHRTGTIMKVLRSIPELACFSEPLSLAVGVFDGLHLGHQAVLHSRPARGTLRRWKSCRRDLRTAPGPSAPPREGPAPARFPAP